MALRMVGSISVMNRQPDRRLVGGRPFDLMSLVGRDVDEIAGFQLDGLLRTLEAEPRRALQHHDPLVLTLDIPESARRGMTVGDNPLDADLRGFEQCGEKLVVQAGRKVGEEVGGGVHD